MNNYLNGRGQGQSDRIRMLIENSFKTPEEEARILNIVKTLDGNSKSYQNEKAINLASKAEDSPEEPYVFGAQSATKENDNMQLFGGQINFNNINPTSAPSSQSSGQTSYVNTPRVATLSQYPMASNNNSNNRPPSANSLDALLRGRSSNNNINNNNSSSSSSSNSGATSQIRTSSSVAPKPSTTSKPNNVSNTVKNNNQSNNSNGIAGTITAAFAKKTTNTTASTAAVVASSVDPLTSDDFMNIELVCRNAGASTESLSAFIDLITPSAVVVMCAVYSDGNTSHQSVTNKYCTPSVQCSNWLCSCDRHIRAVDSSNKFIGVAMMIFNNDEEQEEEHTTAESCMEFVYFLPLVKCNEPSVTQSTSILPFDCTSTLTERWEALLTILANVSIRKIVFNSQLFLFPIMRYLHHSTSGIAITNACCNFWDPKIASYLCNSDVPEENLELYNLLVRYKIIIRQSVVPTNNSTIVNEGKMTRIFYKLRDELRSIYSLVLLQENEMLALDGLLHCFGNIEMPGVTLLSSMESGGIPCKVEYLNSIHRELTKLISELEDKAMTMVRSSSNSTINEFNLASPEQVAHILYHHLKLPPPTSHGGAKHASTSEESLLKIRRLHPIVDIILQFRAVNKLLTTYCSTSFTQFVHTSADGVAYIHANWNQTIVRTGRLSCSKPNLQNIPNRQQVGGVDVNIREAVEVPPGYLLVSADYSQIEMRVLAHLCQDHVMIELFNRDKDIYRQLASKIMNKRPENITVEERNKAKVVCLGVLYGMGAPATAAKLGIDVGSAHQITNSFFNHFKQMKTWIQNIKSQAKQYGYIKTLLGRRRYLPDIQSGDRSKIALGERQAVNSVIQGTASDLIKYAMLNVDKALGSFIVGNRSPKLIMQIHDELIYSFPVEYCVSGDCSSMLTDESCIALDEFVNLLHQRMNEDVVSKLKLKIPLLVNVKQGKSWGTLSDYVTHTHTSVTEGETEEDLNGYFETFYNNENNADDSSILIGFDDNTINVSETRSADTQQKKPTSESCNVVEEGYDLKSLYDEGW